MKSNHILVLLLSSCGFLVFFQTYLFAPILIGIASDLRADGVAPGWIITAYTLPYGVAALFYGPISDRIGRMRVVLTLLALTSVTVYGAAFAHSMTELLLWRVACGIASGGIIPITIAIVGDLFVYENRGRPLGWIYSGMAGGAAFGSTFGAYLNPILGWRMELGLLAALTLALFAWILRYAKTVPLHLNPEATLRKTFVSYWGLLKLPRGRFTYPYILLNSSFHSGVFTWLGWYFIHRYGLSDQGVGLALLGYGIPGMILGPLIGRFVDRKGRNVLLPIGFAVSAASAALLAPEQPLFLSTLFTATLSLGYDMTQPLLGGLATSLDPKKRGQGICLSAFCLFVGFGLGPLVFELFLSGDMSAALLRFAIVEGALAILSLKLFRLENLEAARLLE